LSDLATIRTGVVTARKKADLSSSEKYTYNLISLKCFEDGIYLDKNQIDTFIAHEKIDDRYFAKESDVIVRLRSPNRAIYIEKTDEGLLINSLFAIIRVHSDELDPKYLAYFINANQTQLSLKKDIKGTAIAMLKTKDLEKLEIVLPPIQKQKKLVEFLELSYNERVLLKNLIKEKQKFSQSILDNIIQQTKDN
jgi:restriction endonuclease S subunit